MTAQLHTPREALLLLHQSVARAGGVSAWAREHKTSVGYVSQVMSGDECLGPKILGALRMRKVARYVLVDEVEAVPTEAREPVDA